jgi:hypothetical protein
MRSEFDRRRARTAHPVCGVLMAAGWLAVAAQGVAALPQGRPAKPVIASQSVKPPRNEAPRSAVAPPPSDPRARQIVELYLRQGLRQPYVAEQTTRLLESRVLESTQIVKHAGPARERIEYLTPRWMRGEIILIDGGRLYDYKPGPNARILEGVASPEELQNRAADLLRAIRTGRTTLNVVGTQIIAGQNAVLVEIRTRGVNRFYKRMAIDEKTGVRLRLEDLSPRGIVVREVFVTKIDYTPIFERGDFRADLLPAVRREPRFPTTAPLESIAVAQAQVPYSIRTPSVPVGFALNGVWVVGMSAQRRTTILRYSDGVTTFALFETPAAPRMQGAPRSRVQRLPGAVSWVSNGLVFSLIGNLKAESVDRIIASLD